jgi:hypothetical protein
MTDKPDDPPKPSKGGRPRVAEPGVPVATWLPSREYDKLIQTANAQDTTVSSLVRTWLRLQLK